MPSKFITKLQILYLTCCYNFISVTRCYAETDTLSQGQVLREGDYLNSANKIFKLKFFSGRSKNSKYLGIVYNADNYPVWIADRDAPVPNKSLMLMLDVADGLIKISHTGGSTIVSNTSPVRGKNTTATILDNGNLLLRLMNPDGSINRTLWQSFDYPTDTFLPGMKLGIDLRTGQKWTLTSWMSTTTKLPGPSSFVLGGDPNGSSQLVMRQQGSVYWRSGVWENGHFGNTHFFGRDFDLVYVENENERYLMYAGPDNVRPLRKFRVYSEGNVMFLNAESQVYSFLACSDAENLEPSGCVAGELPECRKVDPRFRGRRGFVEGSGFVYDQRQLSLFDCKERCRQNCSCIAFALVNNSGMGCKIFDRGSRFKASEEYGELVYFLERGKAKRWWPWLVAAVTGTLLVSIIFCYIKRKNIAGREKAAEKTLLQELEEASMTSRQYSGVIDIKGTRMKSQVGLFSFESLEMATNSFSDENKLGQGGFGSDYKGKLASGQEIAMKRLSRSSGQGLLEFKNEILLIAKLQHDNLVKLLGCCIERQEKILVYEYMPNRSLDFFLFDPSRRESIKWRKRVNIIEGVAQGLLYLHKYSRLKVIHRDLKASNILLDQNMNPKISDFGMARIFGKLESEANTNRIVGTHGYMSPECINGVISDKSDVFSFGVLLLEIVSAKKSYSCYQSHSQRPLNLIGLAWELWVEGQPLELVDQTLDESNNRAELLRCINISLLCVQNNAKDRPSMADVITMFANESLLLQQPKQPAFFISSNSREETVEVPCANDMSISVMDGR